MNQPIDPIQTTNTSGNNHLHHHQKYKEGVWIVFELCLKEQNPRSWICTHIIWIGLHPGNSLYFVKSQRASLKDRNFPQKLVGLYWWKVQNNDWGMKHVLLAPQRGAHIIPSPNPSIHPNPIQPNPTQPISRFSKRNDSHFSLSLTRS